MKVYKKSSIVHYLLLHVKFASVTGLPLERLRQSVPSCFELKLALGKNLELGRLGSLTISKSKPGLTQAQNILEFLGVRALPSTPACLLCVESELAILLILDSVVSEDHTM